MLSLTPKPKTVTKVLPFDTKQGRVEGHEICRHHYEWMKNDPIKHVVFWTFNSELGMPMEILIHWTRWTEYTKRAWPGGGGVKAVLLESGRRVHAEGRSWFLQDRYDTAPLACRDITSITLLGGSRATLLEVLGVEQWVRKGTPMECPWERDNAAYRAQGGL